MRRNAIGAIAAMYVVLSSGGCASAGDADYELARGDTIELSVTGIGDLRARSMIGPDGDVTLPMLGQIKAAGSTLADLRARVQNAFAAKPFRNRGQDGRDALTMIAPEQVGMSIAEYRPIYLNGDVSKPGEQAFRPGMTARQAITLAGGYDLVRYRMNNPYLEVPELKAQHDGLLAQYVNQQALVLRLQAELAGVQTIDTKALIAGATAPDVTRRIVDMATKELTARLESYRSQRKFLDDAIANEVRRVDVMTAQQKHEAVGVSNDAEELGKLQDYQKRGVVPANRITDFKRMSLLQQSRSLESGAQLLQVERARDEQRLKLLQFDDDRRLRLLSELQKATVELERLRPQFQAVGEKFAYAGLVKSQLTRGTAVPPIIEIVRQVRDRRETFIADEDALLQPGDVVEIAIRNTSDAARSANK